MEDFQAILDQYQVKLEFAEQHSPRLVKVYSPQGTFALKSLRSSRSGQFADRVRSVYESGYTSLVPIYRNMNNQLVTAGSQGMYYLMPWLPDSQSDERSARHDYLFKEAAKLHRQTVNEVKLKGGEAEASFEAIKKSWEDQKNAYETYVEKCEKQWYLSPFELQAVTYFTETARATDFAIEKLEEWNEAMKEKETARTSFIHGSLSVQHVVYDSSEKSYLINFEKAHRAPPMNDLLQFYYKTFNTYPIRCEECVDWFYTYQKDFPFTKEEMPLFISYLAYPEALYRAVLSRENQRNRPSQLQENKELIKAYWYFKNNEYFVMRLVDIENKKKAEAQTEG
ncbi:spore coat protein YsxE [Bacillus sp. FJAT-42376]|uniref:spore coat protein YsxE n=1 Tax=Bacillus sp. FJAT-42376 TaxID=2014076 RepID=UPI000F4E0D36|nr:spore coat protein YsxE [Bacillus sp. FJAT-42376]AZB43825.1 spore coat protein YsxE [Bacillus sp. FJAT-42376]